MASRIQVSSVIVDQLAGGEKGVLRLVVAVRQAIGRSEKIKGDLSQIVNVALRKLVASQAVVEVDGMYSLPKPK